MSTSPTLRSAFLIMLLNMFHPMTTRPRMPKETVTTAVAATASMRFLRREAQVSAATYLILFIPVHAPVLVSNYPPVLQGDNPFTEGVYDILIVSGHNPRGPAV